MGPVVPPPRTLRFGVFELNMRSGELWKQGRKVRLEGQPVQIFLCFLETPGGVVTREPGGEGAKLNDIPASELAASAVDLPQAKTVLRSLSWKRSSWALLLVLVGVTAWMLRPKNAPSPVLRSLAVF